MALTPVLFPIGPLHLAGEVHHGVMVCTPGEPVETVWAPDWQTAFGAAADLVPDDEWTVPPGAETLCDRTRGRAGDMGPAEALKLARLVGQAADPVGFRLISGDRPGYALMRAMADLAADASGLPMNRTQPVTLEITEDGDRSMFAAAISRDATGLSLYVVQNLDTLRTLIATSFGAELPEDLGFVMAHVGTGAGGEDPNAPAILTATQTLFGTGFVPSIRARSVKGVISPVEPDLLGILTLALFRASAIARGADVVDGEISLHDGTYAATMERSTL